MRLRNVLATSVAGFSILACASASNAGVTTNNDPTGPSWTGNLQPQQQRTGNVAVTGQIKAFGSVTVTPAPGALSRMHVAITVAIPTTGVQSVRWAVVPGRCGSGDPALGGDDQYPLLDIGSNGRGQTEADLPLAMEASGTYHVNVYGGGHELENVITCGNLKFNPAH